MSENGECKCTQYNTHRTHGSGDGQYRVRVSFAYAAHIAAISDYYYNIIPSRAHLLHILSWHRFPLNTFHAAGVGNKFLDLLTINENFLNRCRYYWHSNGANSVQHNCIFEFKSKLLLCCLLIEALGAANRHTQSLQKFYWIHIFRSSAV